MSFKCIFCNFLIPGLTLSLLGPVPLQPTVQQVLNDVKAAQDFLDTDVAPIIKAVSGGEGRRVWVTWAWPEVECYALGSAVEWGDLFPRIQPASDSSWLGGIHCCPFLLCSQESQRFLDCQLGYFTEYADWAKDKVRLFQCSQIHVIISQTSNGAKNHHWSATPLLHAPTDHQGDGTLRAGGQNGAVGWDNSVLTAGERIGNHLAPSSLKVVSSTLRLYTGLNTPTPCYLRDQSSVCMARLQQYLLWPFSGYFQQ